MVNLFYFKLNFETTEALICEGWENGFVEASAKNNENVTKVLITSNILYVLLVVVSFALFNVY